MKWGKGGAGKMWQGGQVISRVGARSDQAHVASHHINELGQLVDFPFAQEPPGSGNPIVASPRELDSQFLAVEHRPELQNTDSLAPLPHPVGSKKQRPW